MAVRCLRRLLKCPYRPFKFSFFTGTKKLVWYVQWVMSEGIYKYISSSFTRHTVFISSTQSSFTANSLHLQHTVFIYSTQSSFTAHSLYLQHTVFIYSTVFYTAHSLHLQHTIFIYIAHSSFIAHTLHYSTRLFTATHSSLQQTLI
jgi:hypothetical protein